MKHNLSIERRLGDWVRARTPGWLVEFTMFVLKQAWACLFGLLFIVMLIGTSLIWQPEWALQRYDALFVFAVTTQVLFLLLKLESWREAKVILIFHIVGTVMEVFKLHMGSWNYPEPGLVKLGGVPLFSGFMYACVGSYMARVIRIFDMRFAPYPPFWITVLLALAIYGNFFWHHFTYDIRLILFAATILIFWRTRVWFFVGRHPRWMPLPLAAFLSSFFLWLAENVGTFTGTWAYKGQATWQLVGFAKLGSWYLLLYVSFLLVTLVYRDALFRQPQYPGAKTTATGLADAV
ncbi:MAG: DUF817 domain-containing protein [Alphaproteobacteria bacterium]|nr:DUF817 domain-containing protein [Alphaproteobacteria bacterium]